MDRLILLSMILGLGGIASIGVLGVNFDIIAQALGVFHTEDVELIGCDCVDTSGNTVPCDNTLTGDIVTADPLCPTSPSTTP